MKIFQNLDNYPMLKVYWAKTRTQFARTLIRYIRVVHTRGSGQHSYEITQHILLPGGLSKHAVTRQFIKIHCYQTVYQNTLLPGSLSKYPVTRQFIKIHCNQAAINKNTQITRKFIKIHCYLRVYQNTLLYCRQFIKIHCNQAAIYQNTQITRKFIKIRC